MKSERRHDLSENYLAKWLASASESIVPFKNQIYWTVIGILALICIGFIWSNISRSGQAKAWGDYLAAMDSQKIENLEGLSNEYTSGEVAARIRLTSGEFLLFEACDEIHTDKDKAREKLEKSLDFFLAAQEKAPSSVLLNEQVLYDLGRAYESLALIRTGQDDLASATKTYQQLLSRYPEGIYAKEAEKSFKVLESPAMSRLMKYYADFTPTPAPGSVPGTETSIPQVDPTVPSLESPIQMPEGIEMPENLEMPEGLDIPDDLLNSIETP